MSTIITMTVWGAPTGKGRPRACVRGGHAATYTDAKTQNAENSFLAQALVHKPAEPLAGPLAVTIEALCPIPASWPKKKRQLAVAGLLRPTGRPDADNLAKLVIDALNGVFYRDDAQITDLTIRKRYDPTTPRTQVTIETLTESHLGV